MRSFRLYFDGVRVAYASSGLKPDALVLAKSSVDTGIFDNTSTQKAPLWGIYSTCTDPKSASVDGYLLGINHHNTRFDEGIADEVRYPLIKPHLEKRD